MTAKTILRTASIRPTPIRLHILRLLEKHHLLSADQILDLLNQTKKTADRVTVYRNLDLLNQQGALCLHHFQKGPGLYEIRSHHHHHLVCNRCQTIETLDDCRLHIPTPKSGFTINHHHLEFFGLCQNCQQKGRTQ